jgi:hypothetical protein
MACRQWCPIKLFRHSSWRCIRPLCVCVCVCVCVRVCVCVYIQRTYQRGTCDTACSRFRCIGSSTRTPSKLCRQHLEHHYMEVSCKSETALLRTQQVLLRRSRQNPLPSSACQTARQEDGSLPLHMLRMYVCVQVCVCVTCVCECVCMFV